jgi:hypothetical protein
MVPRTTKTNAYTSWKRLLHDKLHGRAKYVKLAIDEDYTLYAEEEYRDEQKEPLINIEKLPVLKAVKITVQQISGSFKYLPWEFYAGRVG